MSSVFVLAFFIILVAVSVIVLGSGAWVGGLFFIVGRKLSCAHFLIVYKLFEANRKFVLLSLFRWQVWIRLYTLS